MIRLIRFLMSGIFNAALIASAFVVYIEGVYPYLDRTFATIPLSDTALARGIGEAWRGGPFASGR